MQRKTKAITLTMLAGTAIALGGCLEDEPKPMANEAECVERTGDAEACKAAAEQAQKTHEEEAPRFASVAECEEKFGPGKCNTVSTPSGGSTVMPAMLGFLLGQSMANGQRVYSTQPYYGRPDSVRPGSWTASKVHAARPVVSPGGSPAVVRGGFGRSAITSVGA